MTHMLHVGAPRASTPMLTPPRRPKTSDGADHRPSSSPLRTRGVLRPEPAPSLNDFVSTELSQESVDELAEVISRATTAHSGSRAGTAHRDTDHAPPTELAVGSVALDDDWSVHSGAVIGGSHLLSAHSHHSQSLHSQPFPGGVDDVLELETLEKGRATHPHTISPHTLIYSRSLRHQQR